MRIDSLLTVGNAVVLEAGTIKFPLVILPFRLTELLLLREVVVTVPITAALASVKVLTLVGIEPEAEAVPRTSSLTLNTFEPFKLSILAYSNLVSCAVP